MIRANTCLWGGRFNPIIPYLTRVPPWWDRHSRRFETATQIVNGYLDFFEPDFIVEAEPGLADGLGYDSDRILQLPEVLAPEERWHGSGHGLGVFDLYRDLYQSQYRFAHRHEHDIIDVSPMSAEFYSFCACLFGAFPTKPELTYISRAFIDAFGPRQVTLDGVTLKGLYTTGFTSALRLGCNKVEARYHSDRDAALFVLDASQPRDLVDFWNLRATRPQIVPIPVQWISELSDFCKRFTIENYKPAAADGHGVTLRATTIFARSILTDTIESLYDAYIRTDNPSANLRQNWYPRFWVPASQYIVRETRPNLVVSERTLEVQWTEENPAVVLETIALGFAEKHGNDHRWANVIRMRDWTGSQIATAYPCEHRTSSYPNLGVSREPMLSTTEGLVVFPRSAQSDERWIIPNGGTSIRQWLGVHGIDTMVSPSGRGTQNVIDTLGGLLGVSSIAHPDVVTLLNKISNSPSRSVHHQEFEERIRKATASDAWRYPSFQKLVERGAVELGLEVRCTRCLSWSWYSLPQLDYQIVCGLCLRRFQFPIVHPKSEENTKWAYRLVGAFALPHYAEGGYASALAMRFFSEVISKHGNVAVASTAGLELQLSSKVKVESDFILWFQRKALRSNDYPTEIVFGEAKSFGRAGRSERTESRRGRRTDTNGQQDHLGDTFRRDDIDRMKSGASQLQGRRPRRSGVDP